MVLFRRRLASFTDIILCLGTRWIQTTDEEEERTKTYLSQNQKPYNIIIVNDFS